MAAIAQDLSQTNPPPPKKHRAALPLGPETSQQPLLATPRHG
jgi:hypothetical protein